MLSLLLLDPLQFILWGYHNAIEVKSPAAAETNEMLLKGVGNKGEKWEKWYSYSYSLVITDEYVVKGGIMGKNLYIV